MISVKLYTRKDCDLCEQTRADLESLQSIVPHQLVEIDVSETPILQQELLMALPVVEVGPYKMKAPIERKDLEITLRAVLRGEEQNAAIDKVIAEHQFSSSRWTKADSVTYWLSKHYLAFLNSLVLIYFGLPFLAPILMKYGITFPANLIYKAYANVCHQLAFRSWFLFGEQGVYPRAAAGVKGFLTFEQATGMNSQDLFGARAFIGNTLLGYKVALCERDVAIYGAILIFGLVYTLIRKRLPALPWYLWILIGILPIGLDGFSQLFSQPPFYLIPYRESTPFLRTLTGAIFGLTTAWFGYPLVEETMADTVKLLEDKLARLKRTARIPVENEPAI
jgi:uncharacterized membrane protein